jgi:hypothetical protein
MVEDELSAVSASRRIAAPAAAILIMPAHPRRHPDIVTNHRQR